MSIRVETFGTMPDGASVEKYVLTGAGELTVSLITFGATVQRMTLGGEDMILGYDDLDSYIHGDAYLGASVGRYGNRISGGRFVLDGIEYHLPTNENGINCLHGGHGFSHRLWHATVAADGAEPAVTFSRLSPNGEDGFPGNMVVSVTYTLTKNDALRIDYEAKCDAPTVLNLINHSYFTLGCDGLEDKLLWIDSDAINQLDKNLIPTGRWLDVTGTPFDFREMKPIARDINAPDDEQIAIGGGYDHNFLLNGEGYRHVMTACSVKTGVKLTCCTDQPAAQFYTSNMMKDATGLDGRPMGFRAAFCFETQHCADSPNHPSFPSTRLEAGETFRSATTYQFARNDDLL